MTNPLGEMKLQTTGTRLSAVVRKLRVVNDPWRDLFFVFFAGLSITVFTSLLDYGLTWDEATQTIYGESIIKWYSSGFSDHRAIDYFTNYLCRHGGFFEVVAQLATRIIPFRVLETRHFLSAVFGLATIAYAYKLGTQLSGPLAGLFSAVFLTLTPVFYGHVFNNPKDIPFACLFVVSLHYIYRAYETLPTIPGSLIMKVGVSTGLAMGIRVGGILLFEYLLVFCLAWLVLNYVRQSPRSLESVLNPARNICISLFVVLGIAWLMMLIWWPWAQVSPLFNPLRALRETANFHVGMRSFFNGYAYLANQVPRSYLPVWLGVSLPEFYFLSLSAGACFGLVSVIRFRRTNASVDKVIKLGLLVFVFGFPVASSMTLASSNYDGLRHFLFLIPPLSVLAGISFAHLMKSRTLFPLKVILSLAIFISLIVTVVDMIQLHPYQSIYFNRMIAGGETRGAARFETDYWGASYKEGAEWVIQNYHSSSPGRTLVANCAVPFLSSYYFINSNAKDTFTTVFPNQDPQILLANTRWDCQKSVKGKVLHVVERQGVPLVYVIEVDQTSAAASSH